MDYLLAKSPFRRNCRGSISPGNIAHFFTSQDTTSLQLLASVASVAASDAGPTTPTTHPFPPSGLSSRGPYNPTASLPLKIAKVLDLDFIEMSEISLDDPLQHSPGHPPLLACPPIQNISVWVEKFSVMAALLASRFPEKAPELFAYQPSIVRAERNFVDNCWVDYDRCYRREALAAKNLDWSVPNARLYDEAFTGRARAIPRCSVCIQEDHSSQACPRNPNWPWFGWFLKSGHHRHCCPPLHTTQYVDPTSAEYVHYRSCKRRF